MYYDTVVPPDASQNEVYEKCCQPLMNQFVQGFNCCLLAYGQTGAGKSYTMGTQREVVGPQDVGIIPRAAQWLWEWKKAAQASGATQIAITVTFIEIHNEEMKDLLAVTRKSGLKSLRIAEDPVTRNINVLGARCIEAKSLEGTLKPLTFGLSRRTTACNRLNALSSRSHAIFTLGLHFVQGGETFESKFNFVDLAGSERVKRTGSEGERFTEGIHINGGLLALSNVISILSTCNKPGCHIPYRDSRLTRILQDALGGNSQTTMIVCVSSSKADTAETIHTLRYACRAKGVKNSAVVNRDTRTVMVEGLQRQIHQLTCQLLATKRKVKFYLYDLPLPYS